MTAADRERENEYRRQRRAAKRPPVNCAGCGARFQPARANQHYHSAACRQKAYRLRSTPLADVFHNTLDVNRNSCSCDSLTNDHDVNMSINSPAVIAARVPTALAEQARAAAEAEDRSISSFTRRALHHELQRINNDEHTTQRTAA